MMEASTLRASAQCTAMLNSRHCASCSAPLRYKHAPCRQKLLPLPLQRRAQRQNRSQSRGHAVCAAGPAIKDPYKILEVEMTASDQMIKKAFKQKAKQLHPDVNKAPDAAERFMECKMAYQLLIDPSKRKQYDRQHKEGFDWGDFVDGIASGGAKQRKQESGEPFYGFTDFLRDLDVDLQRWSSQVDKKGFKSLFDELYDAGLVAVGALEKGLGLSSEELKRKASASSTSSSGAASSGSTSSQSQQPSSSSRSSAKPPGASPEDEAEAVRRRVQAFEQEAEQKKQQAEKEVDDMLADLKKRLKER